MAIPRLLKITIGFVSDLVLVVLSILAVIGLFVCQTSFKEKVKWISEKYLEWFITHLNEKRLNPRIKSWFKKLCDLVNRRNQDRDVESGFILHQQSTICAPNTVFNFNVPRNRQPYMMV